MTTPTESLQSAQKAAEAAQVRLWEAHTALYETNPLAAEALLQPYSQAADLSKQLGRLVHAATSSAAWDQESGL